MRKAPKSIPGKPGKGLFGKKQIGLTPDEGRKNMIYGTAPLRDEKWPLGYVETNPLAAEVANATKEGTR